MIDVIKTVGLTKKYRDVTAVDNMNLSINRGEIFGFLGLNGAGKTTTITMLLGMVAPTSGQCFILGKKVDKGNTTIWSDVGYLVETPYFYPNLTVRENLEIYRKLRGLDDNTCVDRVIKKLKLDGYESMKAKHLSLGNAQRLGIAKAIIHSPKILILDEPTNGLDPAGIVEIRSLLKELSQNSNVTIFISSHKLEEISRIATNIAIIHEGKLIKNIDAKQLHSQLKKTLIIDGRNRDYMEAVLSNNGYIVHRSFDSLQIVDEHAVNNPDKVAVVLVNAGCPPTLLKVEVEDLEMYFLRTISEIGGTSK